MNNKICPTCGTTDDAHHSAACIGLKENGVNSPWHPDHRKAINEKWIYSDKHAIEELNRLSKQNAEMLAMLKATQVEMQHVAKLCKHEFSLPFCIASFEATTQELDNLIKKVEGENGK